MLRALVVSYNFPPVGGAGVQRVVKLVKYLPEHGVRPAVLTVANPSVPVVDHSLAGDVPPAVEVVRARTFEPDYAVKRAAWQAQAGAAPASGASAGSVTRALRGRVTSVARQLLIPDPQILWQPAAAAALARRLVARADDVVLVSAPPFSQFLLAPLARLGRVPIVLDYRDEWSTYRTTYEMMGSLGGRVGPPLERALIARAAAVTTATEEFRAHLIEQFPFLDPARVVTIPNGFDRDDFPAALPSPPNDRFVLTYAGTVFKLTSPRGLVGALRRLQAAEPALAARLRVRVIGRIVDTEAALFDQIDGLDGVERVGYVDHAALPAELAQSHLTLCLLDDVPGNERIFPAKIFELMALGRPILTLAPEGALTRLCRAHQLGDVLPPRDEAAIAALLARRLREFVDGKYDLAAHPVDIERYDRRAQAGQFAGVLRRAAGGG